MFNLDLRQLVLGIKRLVDWQKMNVKQFSWLISGLCNLVFCFFLNKNK